MVKRLRASLALFISLALVLLSPGLEAPRLFAQMTVRTAPIAIAPSIGLSAASPLAAPSIFASAALTVAPALAVPSALAAAPAASPAASLPEMAVALAPHLEAAAKADTSASGAAAAGRGIEAVITGQRSAGSGDISSVEGVEGFGAPSLGAAASAPVEAAKPAVAAAAAPAAPAAPKTVNSAASYGFHRFLLKTVAKLTGGVYSLPIAGAALTRKLIASAADKSVVFSDYDDTLAQYSQVLPADMVAAVEAIKAAGKTFVLISDRGDEPRKGQMTVFESLASLPAATRAGMYVAANSGGRVYRYDDKGEPVRVFEAPVPDAAEKAKLNGAVDAAKARMKEIGAEQFAPGLTDTIPAESWNVYSYAMMLKVGSDDAHVRGTAHLLESELAKRGYDIEVNPRYAKEAGKPPYITFSLVTKKTAASFIATALKAEAKDVLVIGDSMYTPRVPGNDSWLSRLGEKVSGLALPRTGNRTDRNMELAVPGALMFSVGASGDPRASNLFVLAGKGPSVTLQVLRSVASKKAGETKGGGARDLVVPAIFLAAVGASYYFMIHGLTDLLAQWENSIRSNSREFVDGGILMGGTLGTSWYRRRAKPGEDTASRYKTLESGYRASLAAIPGVVSVKIRNAPDSMYGSNRLTGKNVEVVFDGVASLQAAQASGKLPKELPAISGVDDVAKYNVEGLVADDARRAAYAALEKEHAARLSAIPGVVSVKIRNSPDTMYGDNRLTGKNVEVVFDGVASLQAAQASGKLPKDLPAISGVDDVAKYNVKGSAAKPSIWRAAAVGTDAWRAAGGRDFLTNPGTTYSEALKQAVKAAAARGVPASEVRFVEATASMPVADGAHWKYTFAIPGKTVVYVDMGRHLSSGLEARTSVYTGVPDMAGFASDFAPFWANSRLDPQAALDLANKSLPSLGGGVSVALAYREDRNLWYRFYANNGAVVSVNARSEAVEVDKAVSAESGASPKLGRAIDWKYAAVVVGFFAAMAAIYAAISWAMSDVGASLGGALGFGALAGTIRPVKKPPVGNDEIDAAAQAVVSYKGGIWSQSEYDGGYFNAADDLRKRGATKEQMERFKKLCDEAPIIDGRFNRWAGD